MINPYGDDDEDFDLNYLLNRHNKVINTTTLFKNEIRFKFRINRQFIWGRMY